MPILEQLQLTELLKLLVKQTAHHTQLIARGATADEFAKSRDALMEIQMQIQSRDFRMDQADNASGQPGQYQAFQHITQ